MSRSHEGSDEIQLRSVIIPGAVELRAETMTQAPAAGRGIQAPPAAEGAAPAMLDDFRDRPTIPFHG